MTDTGNLPVPGPGRDSKYKPEYNVMAKKLALLGATDEEMAAVFDIDVRTLHRWKSQFPAFCHSLTEGKIVADANVAESLYKRAIGQDTIAEKVIKGAEGQYEKIELKTFIPGDTGAAKLWLTNRRRQNWSERQEMDVSGGLTINFNNTDDPKPSDS